MTSLRELLACNIRAKRNARGLSQSAHADKAHASTHYIAMIELARKFPSADMMERIALALGIDSPELFSMTSFPSESIKNLHTSLLNEVESAVANIVAQKLKCLDDATH
jgi:transcriptional regulator with XRE-family HTH domain